MVTSTSTTPYEISLLLHLQKGVSLAHLAQNYTFLFGLIKIRAHQRLTPSELHQNLLAVVQLATVIFQACSLHSSDKKFAMGSWTFFETMNRKYFS